MCGRFALINDPLALAEYFQAESTIDFSPKFNIAPSAQIITVTAGPHGLRQLNRMQWGLIPNWAKDPSIGNKLANARGETVAEKPSFRSAFRTRRCLIPASGFYEWKTVAGKKYPWYISLRSGEPLAMAGLWEMWKVPGAEPIVSCCIITTDANELMQPIHDRMPVILDRAQWTTWLSPAEHRPAQLLSMIRPHDSAAMQAWPVTRDLNRVGLRDDADLIEPCEAP
ncbi:MAG TPA: SOS response-associated peptidase [Candidatus Paceibacterota bacterium]